MRMSRVRWLRNALPPSVSTTASRVAPRRCFSTRIANATAAGYHDNRLRFPGALEAKFTNSLQFGAPRDAGVVPCYRVLDSEGVVVDSSYEPDFSDEEAVELYTQMVGVSIMDLICLDAQRQGMPVESQESQSVGWPANTVF